MVGKKWDTSPKYTTADLIQRQSLPLEQKILLSKKRIREWWDENDGMVYTSFSGGKDSTVLKDLVDKTLGGGQVPTVFIDTGLEYPDVRENALQNADIVVKPEKSFRKVVMELGYPVASKEIAKKVYYARKGSPWALQYLRGERVGPDGKKSQFNVPLKWRKLENAPFQVSARCCDELKKKPVRKFERQYKRKPYLGLLADESSVRKQAWRRTGCNSKGKHSAPLSIWTEKDIARYIKENSLKIPKIYGEITDDYEFTGVNRTGCMFCMFGVHLEKNPNRFQHMKKHYPKQWKYCMKPVEEGGLGCKQVLDFIGVESE